MKEHYSAPEGSFFGSRSNCHWIESAGIEETPPLPPLQGESTADVVIVGGGYTGLSAALHLAERFPERRIVLLEGARVGYGASGRNCGLVLPFINGAEETIHELVEAGRVDEARRIFEATSAGMDLIDDLVAKRGVHCELERVECLLGAITPRHEAKLERQQRMYEAIGLDATWLPEQELRQRVDVTGYRGALTIPSSRMINPAKFARGLLALVRAANVAVHEESPVVEITARTPVVVRTTQGSVRAPVLVLATNAYTHHLGFLRRRILPIHAFSIATAPLTEAQIAALSWSGRQPFYDVRSFFDLFRLTADNRILLSGGDAFFSNGGVAEDEKEHSDYERLSHVLRRMFPAVADVPITHGWTGHVGMTLDRAPTLGAFGSGSNIFFAGGYAGHGVTVAALAGRLLRDLVAGEPIDPAYDFILHRKPPRAPGEPLTSLGFGLAKRYLRWEDAR